MNRRWKGAAAALLTTLTLTLPVLGAEVVVNETTMTSQHAWVEGGTSYITLRAFAAQGPYRLSWEGGEAKLSGDGLELTARPGQAYIIANGRPLYVPGGVAVREGKLVLPLRILAQATGGQLTWDRASATARLGTYGVSPPTAAYPEEDLYWLSRVISAESRGEPLQGQIAVGNVVLNRVNSNEFPNTIKEVVFDRKHGVQFEPVSNGTIYDPPTSSALLAAKLCLEGANVVGNCLYFYAPALSPGTWIVQNRTYHTTIGCHRFYL